MKALLLQLLHDRKVVTTISYAVLLHIDGANLDGSAMATTELTPGLVVSFGYSCLSITYIPSTHHNNSSDCIMSPFAKVVNHKITSRSPIIQESTTNPKSNDLEREATVQENK